MSEPEPQHQPVLVAPILTHLDPQPGQTILDGTVGLGGHALALAARLAPGGCYVGIDLDEDMLRVAERRLADVGGVTICLRQASYADFPHVLADLDIAIVDHMLLDLGMNSAQIADGPRGFSFDRDGPLDMRYDRSSRLTASDIINGWKEDDLSDLFFHCGQEALGRRVARTVCHARRDARIRTTRALAQLVEFVYAEAHKRSARLHPATRVFQALRVAVNSELENLKAFLSQAVGFLRPGGALAVVSFHSIEDGIVKRFMREAKREGELQIVNKSPIGPDTVERRANPRSRSAKLRVGRRLGTEPGG